MSSIDQAFVKAFSRRNRPVPSEAKPVSSEAKPVSSEAKPVASEAKPVSPEAKPVAPGAKTLPPEAKPSPPSIPFEEPGSLKVDPSVAQSASVWVDPIENEIARLDSRNANVPKPHVAAHEAISTSLSSSDTALDSRIDSLQHIHTAYATAAVPQETIPTSDHSTVADEMLAALSQPVAPLVERRIDPPVTRRAEPIDDVAIEQPTAVEETVAPVVEPFHAAWEVDVFDIPTTVADLFFEGQLFQQIAERMLDAVNTGLNSMLVTSVKAGEGRSTVAMGIAMAAAASGIRVALVDGDTENPKLADALRLDLEYGWVDTIRGGLPIKEVAVHAVEDGVTLIPLMPPHKNTAATSFETAQLLSLLKDRFDLVVVDGPAGTSPTIHQYAAEFDSVVIVSDSTRTDATAINEMSYRLRESGVQGIGIVENFS